MAPFVGSPTIEKWARNNGFSAPNVYVDATPPNIRQALGESRQGLYLLEFTNNDIYIGIASDMSRRLPQHRTRWPDIETVRLQHSGDAELRVIERDLVRNAQSRGIVVRNREHAHGHTGPSTLDQLVPVAEQEIWRRDPAQANNADAASLIDLGPSQLAAHAHDFHRFRELPGHEELLRFLGNYLMACVPLPRRTEGTFWTVSCFPSSNKARVFCVSMAGMETLFCYHDPESATYGAAMFVDRRKLAAAPWSRISTRIRGIKRTEQRHKYAGPFEQGLRADGLASMNAVLQRSDIMAAAASFNLDLMRKRQSAYKQSHCRQLAEAALEAAAHQP
ncbi:GIY-YIG nuclease family protein [Lolliginicoccus suaedae]|uniref:GIY-YIG nuclease family protein n=1 Tax=Lolliginicoccus suaedae TaxID=2605429 RepID=UPI0011EE61B4|nr:hypothetical protein [Lolliginicoccus suaedae]